jgi:hypothetical protein
MTSVNASTSVDSEILNETTSVEETQTSTSVEELEGYHSVKAILRELIDPKRIFIRDAQSYCAILLDDNNRKPICRLDFNNPKRLRIRVFKENKEQIIFDLSTVDDIFNYANDLKESVKAYL